MENDNTEFEEMQTFFSDDDQLKDINEVESFKNWIDSKVLIPLEMYSEALKGLAAIEETNRIMQRLDHKGRRIKSCVALDAIILYGWLQYTKRWHDAEGRTKNGCIHASRAYILKALPWSEKRYIEASKYLIKKEYVMRGIEYVRNEETGTMITKKTWWKFPKRSDN